MAENEDWVVWNGEMGILDTVKIGLIEEGEGGRTACLAPPYSVVGPFNLDELEAKGRIAFGACLVMSRLRWQEDQDDLRLAALERRRAALFKLSFNDDQEYRELLDLPMEGELKTAEINSAFRRAAKIAHPDVGGSDEDYRAITEARDKLLLQYASLSPQS
jgi:hypothetical protein